MMVLKGSDECSSLTYGSMVTTLAVVCIISGFIELILHAVCFFHYQANNKLPFMSDSGNKGPNAVQPVQSNASPAAPQDQPDP